MKKINVISIAALIFALISLLCACDEVEEQYINPVLNDPGYITFSHEAFSMSYPVSYTDVEKDGYLLYCTSAQSDARVFGVQVESGVASEPAAVTESAIVELCEKIIDDTLPGYQAAAEKYGVSVTRENFSYTIESIEQISCGFESAARVYYTVHFENDAFAPVTMSFCNVWVFDGELVYLVTFCDTTGSSASESFADFIDYIFCE